MGMYGAGKQVITTLNATYAQLLAGKKKEYAALWTGILQQAARKADVMEGWRFVPALPVVNQPAGVLLQSSVGSLPQGLFEEGGEGAGEEGEGAGGVPVTVYLSQHPLLPFHWDGLYWPREPGWQTARTPQGDRSWWYVWKEEDWRSLHRMERMRETERWIAGAGRRSVQAGEEMRAGEKSVQTREEKGTRKALIAKGWFYLLFLLCCLFLWVERKI